jgi:hypothetical protein
VIAERNGSSETFREAVDQLIAEEVRRFLREVPFASHLTDPEEPLAEPYYLRHRVETIKRIRLTAKVDALALASLIDLDYAAARIWAVYACEELNHDRLFFADLQSHGLDTRYVDDLEIFKSTHDLVTYLTSEVHLGRPLAAVAYSLFVEWNSEQFAHRVVAKAEAQFGRDHARGSKAHIGIDDRENHYIVILELARGLVVNQGSFAELRRHIARIGGFFRDYFRELHRATILQSSS